MTNYHREEWTRERIDAIMERLQSSAIERPDNFWAEIQDVVTHLVVACVDLGDMEWSADLHLGDLVEKHVIRFVDFEDEDDE